MQFTEAQASGEYRNPTVTFLNSPKITEHAIDQAFNEMKIKFVPYIESFAAQHSLFRSESEVKIEFAHKGVSSIIAIMEAAKGKWVLKIPRSAGQAAGEGQFLKVWQEAGVTVPSVIETGDLNGSPYMLMEYIDAPTLDESHSQQEHLDNKVFFEMGQTLRKMHSIKAEGYGSVVEGKPEFESVEAWLSSDDITQRLEYIAEHNLFLGNTQMIEHSLKTIVQHAKNSKSTYCHADFGTANIFATKPITIFDPYSKFNSGYYDLGMIHFLQIAFNNPTTVFEQICEGYFGDEECDKETLAAYTFLIFCIKCRYWHQTGRIKQIEIARKYFFEH